MKPPIAPEIEFATDSSLEGQGFEPSVPRLRWSSVQLAARDATRHLAGHQPIEQVTDRCEPFA
jgi:hypothetical protein